MVPVLRLVGTRVWVGQVVVESQVGCLIVVEVGPNLFLWSLRGRRPNPVAEGIRGRGAHYLGR